MSYARHDEVTVDVEASAGALFDHLDDQERLAGHMEEPSMMMMGGRMWYEFDAAKGRAVGSLIRMGGSFLWLKLGVEEVVVTHEPPRLKVWETKGRPRLVIIGAYRMGFEIAPAGAISALRVFIDYDLPKTVVGRALGALLALFYARWCVSRMAEDAKRRFVITETTARAA
jgi:hypothetical protein